MSVSRESIRAFAVEKWVEATSINPEADRVRKYLFVKGFEVYMEKFLRGDQDESLRLRLHGILSQDLEEFNTMMAQMSQLGFSV